MGARLEEYEADTVILSEGAPSDHKMYIILEGEVILYRNYKKSDEYLIGIRGKGKTFGQMNMFTDEPNFFTIVAYSDVKLAWFEKSNLESFLFGYPSYAINLIEILSKTQSILERNLELAINEIEELRHPISKNSGDVVASVNSDEVSVPLNLDDVRRELNKMAGNDGEYRYIKTNNEKGGL